MTGLSLAVEVVSDPAPWSEIVFDLGPVPAAFTAYESARLHGFNAIEAHQMEFTFVADCLYGLAVTPHPASRRRSDRSFPAEQRNCRGKTSTCLSWISWAYSSVS